MKSFKYFIAAAFIAGFSACNNQDAGTTKKDLMPTSLVTNPQTANGIDSNILNGLPTLDFADTSHSFGSLHEGETVTHDFPFTNNGKGPLIIAGAVGSCGCTVADYPHEALQPGKSAVMKVQFNSTGKFGHVEKMVTISSNAKRGVEHLFIQADVISDKKTN